MIELIVVMAILVILLGIVVVGFKHVASGNQKRQTQTLLERLKNATANTFANKSASQRFFQQQLPTIYGYSVVYNAPAPPTPPSRPTAPDRVWDGVPAAADDSLFKTGMILRAILADPEAKRIFDDIPTERKKDFYFNNSNGIRVDAPTPLVTTTFTLPLDAWGNPILFVYDNWTEATGGTTVQNRVSTTNTIPSTPTTPATPAPAGGLTGLYSDATKLYWEFPDAPPVVQDSKYAARYQRPSSYTPFRLDANSPIVPALRSPDNRPFWTSAGPDGNYATHDDNVYSFEN